MWKFKKKKVSQESSPTVCGGCGGTGISLEDAVKELGRRVAAKSFNTILKGGEGEHEVVMVPRANAFSKASVAQGVIKLGDFAWLEFDKIVKQQ